MLTPAGEAKLLDLGLSKRLGLPDTTVTQTGQFMGTPCYIAPEQAQGDRDLDGRADVYSLGATFFHLVTGCAPYAGQTAVEIVSQHVLSPVPDPRDIRQGIPDEVSFVIRRMMAKNPAERYPDCGALREDLERIDTGRLPRGMPRPAPRPPATAVTIPLAILPAAPTPPRSASRIVFKVLVLLVLLAALAVVLDRQEIVRLPFHVPLPAEVEAWLGWGPSPDAEPGAKPPGGGRPKSAK
jgi:serine/threonine protein kinase